MSNYLGITLSLQRGVTVYNVNWDNECPLEQSVIVKQIYNDAVGEAS